MLSSWGIYGTGMGFYESLGGGAFGPRQVINPTSRCALVLGADVDADGDADLVHGGAEGPRWSENLGGSFGAVQPFGNAYGEALVTVSFTCRIEQLVNLVAVAAATYGLGRHWVFLRSEAH